MKKTAVIRDVYIIHLDVDPVSTLFKKSLLLPGVGTGIRGTLYSLVIITNRRG
jgi:hypothetical protein